jgi:putative cardiolipin synthase
MLLLSLSVALGACAQLQPRADLPMESATPTSSTTLLDRTFAAAEDSHPGESGFRLLVEGTEAFVARMQSARMAERSIDVQTYIWHSDLTGKFLAWQLLDSADRGVKVRLLIDDMDARAKSDHFAALSTHPNIEVRVFNPFASRDGTLSLVSEGRATSSASIAACTTSPGSPTTASRSWAAAIWAMNTSARATRSISSILDFGMVGPVVRDVSASFDRYWNSPSSYPLELLHTDGIDPKALGKLRHFLANASLETRTAVCKRAARRRRPRAPRIGRGTDGMVGRLQIHSRRSAQGDDGKARLPRAAVSTVLLEAMGGAHTAVDIVSPYFVPGGKGSKALIGAARSGKQVKILTNSLAANDVAAVHGGYSRHRPKLLRNGVQLWELKPLAGGAPDKSLFGSSGASLHTKALSIDQKTLFVGSYNLDPRSTWLNCEQGVLVESPVLTAQFRSIFESQTAGSRAWKVSLQGGELRWADDQGVTSKEPETTFAQRMQAWFARVLRLDAQL